ncbi:MAG: inositol monophosphatase [Actinomycetota bacterium]
MSGAVTTDTDDLLAAALRAATAGGAIVRDALGTEPAAETKGTGDYVTEIDRRSETEIKRVLADTGLPVLGEEEGGSRGERYWAVDPLDGTTNFLHGFPAVAVSIALVERERPELGVVHAPFLEETYLAAPGSRPEVRRAGSDPRPLRVSDRSPERAIVGTGFPFRDKSLVPRYLEVFARCFGRFEDLRRPGAAALDLSWVAAGVFDGFFELNLSPWDVAAGAALVRAAGGIVTDWEGHPARWLDTGNILAGSPPVHEALLEICRSRKAGEG